MKSLKDIKYQTHAQVINIKAYSKENYICQKSDNDHKDP